MTDGNTEIETYQQNYTFPEFAEEREPTQTLVDGGGMSH